MLELEEGPSPSDITLDTASIAAPPVEQDRHFHRLAWCFHCHRETHHFQVLNSTAVATHWGPKIAVECGECGIFDADVFPGRERNY